MQTLDSSAARAALRHITHIYTDLDGTLLAPGGRLLADSHNNPSLRLAEALVALKQAGIEVIITTGRDASACVEIMRLTNLDQFIGEMGCVVQYGYGASARKSYNLGEWSVDQFDQDVNHDPEVTPHEIIARSDALSTLLEHFKGRLERHTFKGSHREVTLLLRGNVDVTPGGEVEEVLSKCEPPLQMLDNGIIRPKTHGLIGVEEVHAYHLMPRGTNKGDAVAADMRQKGLEARQCLAIGDSAGDVLMGTYAGSFVLMNDERKQGPETLEAFAEKTVAYPENLFTTTFPSADGWVEFAHALLDAK